MSLLDPPARVTINSAETEPFNGVIFNSSAAVSLGVDNVQDYDDWGFHVTAITAADTLAFQPSLDGGTLAAAILLMNMNTGTVSATVSTTGFYKPVVQSGAAGSYVPLKLRARAWFVTKTGVAGAATVYACGGISQ
jgi:hypothetical protein